MSNEVTSATLIETWKEKRVKASPSLKFKQHSKEITPQGKGHDGVSYPATYEHGYYATMSGAFKAWKTI